MSHPEKKQIIELVSRCLKRSGLTIAQVVARMQATGCDISRHSFENHFTTRADRHSNVPPEYVLALIAALTNGLTNSERCPASEALELARLTRLPIDQFTILKNYFPLVEFITAYKQYIPTLALASEKSAQLAAVDEELSDRRCPYRGLQTFEEEHAEFFFGREAEVEWLLSSLQQSRFLAVIGPSGSGKSSVVRAGLIPALRRGTLPTKGESSPSPINPLIQIIEPGQQPIEALAVALKDDAGRSRTNLVAELGAEESRLHRLALEILDRQPDKTDLVLVVDQFEELFTLCRGEALRRTFIANLLQAAILPDSRAIVILTMRADFYSQAAAYSDLAVYLAEHQVLISPLADTQLAQIITQPAQKVGLHFEEGLVDRLLLDSATDEPGTLPLLEHALLELWERRQGTQLTLAAYQMSGGVQGALAQRADTLLAEFTSEQQNIVRRVMLRLTKLGEGTADTRRRATLSELMRASDEKDDIRAVVNQLADERLVTTSRDRETGEEVIDVAHEALIRGWPTLQGWLTEDRDALRLHQRLVEVTLEWDRNDRDRSYLYRGARLASTEEWAESHADEMNTLEREFLAASLAIQQQDVAEQERRQRRARRNLTIALVTALITLAIMAGLALFAFNRQHVVETQRQEALSRQLASQVRELLDEQFDLALLLSVQANQIADTIEARSSLLTVLQSSPHLTGYLRGHTDWIWSVDFSPDGKTLASGGADGSIILWNVEARQPVRKLPTSHSNWVRTLAFSPDGQTLASGSSDNTILLWDLNSKEPTSTPLRGHTSFVTDVAFSPDGQTLASSSADGTIILWDVATAKPLGSPLIGHTSLAFSVAFSPDGQTLASGGADQSLILWDIGQYDQHTTGQPLAHALTGHQGDVTSVAFSPDGQTLASGSADGTIILWDAASLQPRRQPLIGHKSGVNAIAFSPQGDYLISGSDDKTIIVWDVSSGQPLDKPFIGHTDSVFDLAFNPTSVDTADMGGQPVPLSGMIASGSADGTIILWDLAKRQALNQSLIGHTDSVRGIAFSPDGRMLASGSTDKTIMLWDVVNRQPLGPPLTGHTSFVNDVAFSPDTLKGTGGQILASASDDRSVMLWDVATGQPLGPRLMTNRDEPVLSVAFSPDGQTLVSSEEGEGGRIILWDMASYQPLELPVTGKVMAFSPDGQVLGVTNASNGSIVSLWDVVSDEVLNPPLNTHSDQLNSLAFSPDGNILATASDDRTIILWDVSSHQPIRQPLVGHAASVDSVAFSPDGRIVASGGEDNSIILWDVATHQRLGLPLNNGGLVRSLAFSPNEQLLASSGSNDGAIMLWNLNPVSWQEQACQIAARNLTPAEWEQCLGNESYQLTCPDVTAPILNRQVVNIPQNSGRSPASTTTGEIVQPMVTPVAIIENFDSDRGFIQTSDDIYIAGGQVNWHFRRDGGEQYLYRRILPFNGNVRLVARGQIDSWTSNCFIQTGIGDEFGSGVAIDFGFTGDGCPTNGSLVAAEGVLLDRIQDNCNFNGNWLWIDSNTPYTAELTIEDGDAVLAVEGVGQSIGTVNYEGPYTTLWVGNNGRGDWPECTGTIDSVIVEPLN